MKNRQTGEKRRKEMRRMERQRDKADKRKLRKEKSALGEPDPEGEGGGEEGVVAADGSQPTASLEALAGRPQLDSAHASGAALGAEKQTP